MNVLVVGGKLQGTEITFLAKEAGWHVTLVDRNEYALASKLCDEFICVDVLNLTSEFLAVFDVVLPAIEDYYVLCRLQDLCEVAQVPFMFDRNAYQISSSKQASDSFLAELGVHTPPRVDEEACWKDGYLVKPDSASGSKGVVRFMQRDDALAYASSAPDRLCQVFLAGDVLSVEVICDIDHVESFLVTHVVVGDDFDCHRIVAPAAVTQSEMQAIRALASCIGRGLRMRGIFDIEFIMRNGVPYVLEIDARMPSQTPVAIYCATGTNLLIEAVRVFCPSAHYPSLGVSHARSCSILQHVRINRGTVELIGECCLADAPALVRDDGLFGADVALAAYSEDRTVRYATLIVCGSEGGTTQMRLRQALENARAYANQRMVTEE